MSKIKVVGTVFLAVALCLAMVIGAAACGGDDETTEAESTDTTVAAVEGPIDAALIGTWHSVGIEPGGTLEFAEEGLMIAISDDPDEGSIVFDCRTEDGTIIISQEGTEAPPASYSIEGDVLTIIDPDSGDPETYERVQ